MSTAHTSNGLSQPPGPASARAGCQRSARVSRPRRRARHTPGGANLGKGADRDTQRLAAAILEVLAGVRTPTQAAEALGMSQPRYYQIETRAVQALVAACAPRPVGRTRSTDKELTLLRRQQERLERELSRQKTLVRLTQRTLGLASPPVPDKLPAGKDKKKRARRPVVRALRAAEVLQHASQESAEPLSAATTASAPEAEPT